MMRGIILLLLTALAWPAAAAESFELDNGMKVIVKEDQRAPVAVSMLWYRVGARDEHDGITGLSHMLEHMMFKGTEEVGPGEFSQRIAALGGRENAFTGHDFTGYFQQVGVEHLDEVLELEADRMRNLTLPEDEFERERRVVQEERRLRIENNPVAILFEQMRATAFLSSPDRNPVAGWMRDIEEYTLDDLWTWYERFYHPDNAVLTVVGDVTLEEVRTKVERHFGEIPAGAEPTRKTRPEIPQRGERRITVKEPAQLPHVALLYKAPPLSRVDEPWEAYALEVAAGILSDGDSARLPVRLERKQQVASSASARYNLYSRGEGTFVLSASPSRDVEPEELEAALREQVELLREEPVGEDELERVQTQVVASEVYAQDSPMTQAMRLGVTELSGVGYETVAEHAERIQAVTAEQVQEVVKRYLSPENVTVGMLDPLPIDADEPPREEIPDEQIMH